MVRNLFWVNKWSYANTTKQDETYIQWRQLAWILNVNDQTYAVHNNSYNDDNNNKDKTILRIWRHFMMNAHLKHRFADVFWYEMISERCSTACSRWLSVIHCCRCSIQDSPPLRRTADSFLYRFIWREKYIDCPNLPI